LRTALASSLKEIRLSVLLGSAAMMAVRPDASSGAAAKRCRSVRTVVFATRPLRPA
jgi:hypothetical protein